LHSTGPKKRHYPSAVKCYDPDFKFLPEVGRVIPDLVKESLNALIQLGNALPDHGTGRIQDKRDTAFL